MNIQLTPAKIMALLKTLIAWIGLIISVTDAVPQLHNIRPTMLACSSALLAIEHGIHKMKNTGNQP